MVPARRLACVHVPALPLQVLARRHPDWQDHPIAVVDQDKPQGIVQWINERARRCRILPGMRYAAALALSARLRAGTVEAGEVAQEVAAIVAALRAFSPSIEPDAGEPGVLYVDAQGLDGLYPDLQTWAHGIGETLRRLGLRRVAVVVGFDRFCTYALAHTRLAECVLSSPTEERAAADQVPLQRLRLDPELRDTLLRLGVTDVARFRRLAPAELAARSPDAAAALRSATGSEGALLVPCPHVEPARARYLFEPGTHDVDTAMLLAVLEPHLAALRATLAARGTAVRALHLRLLVEKAAPVEVTVVPAAPTLDGDQLLELLHLRLAALAPDGEIEGFELTAEEGVAAAEQLQMFTNRKHRDLAAGRRALARLRAAFGDEAVVHATLADGHLPEARFRWQPCTTLPEPAPRPALVLGLVRRQLSQPQPLPHQQPGEDGWFVGRLNFGPVQNLFGPYVVAGGWWRKELHREYHFAQTRRGDIVWLFHDRLRRKWYTQGGIE